MAAEVIEFEPRPVVLIEPSGVRVAGGRCAHCGHTVAGPWPRCPVCKGELEPASFGPTGRIWASSVIRFALPGRTPPYALAYVDIDDGPRVLAHVRGYGELGAPLVGAEVELCGRTAAGDVEVEVTS